MSKFCRKCGSPLKPNAKFCGGCGTPTSAVPEQSTEDVMGVGGRPTMDQTPALKQPIARSSHLIWNLEQGQIAQKIPANWMDYYDEAKGLIINPGTMGLFYVNGKFRTRIESGEYIFRDHSESNQDPSGGIGESVVQAGKDVAHAGGGAAASAVEAGGRVFGAIGRFFEGLFGGRKMQKGGGATEGEDNPQITHTIKQEILQATRAKHAIQVVLVRGAGFPIVAQFQGVKTASIQTDVGVELFVYIKDADAFYQKFLIDRTLVTSDQVRLDLDALIQRELTACLAAVKAEDIANNAALISNLQGKLQAQMGNILPYLGVQQVVQVSSDNAELNRIQQLSDELYISEKELEQLVNRNEFKNRLRLEENKQAIRSALQENTLEAEMLNLNKDKLLSQAEFQKHVMFVKNDLRISSAKTEDEYRAALVGIEKSEILREEEIAILHDQIKFKQESQEEAYRSSLDLQHISSRIETAKAELRYEREVGDDQLELEAERSRKSLLQEWDEQRIGLEIEKEKAQSKAGIASAEVEARKIWADFDREQEKLKRKDDLELQQQEDAQEIDKLKAMQELKEAQEKAEHDRDMQATQIAAESQVKRLEAEAQRWKGMSVEEIMAANPEISDAAANAFAAKYSGEKAEQAAEEKKQMVDDMMDRQERMMKEMMGTVAQVASGQSAQKDKEVERARENAQVQTEAVTKAVGAGAAAVGEGIKGTPKASAQPTPASCPECGAAIPADSAFCTSCGHQM